MSLAITELQVNYLKLRHDLAAAGYRLGKPIAAADLARASQIGRTICHECNNLLTYQVWTKDADQRSFAVCMECYTATEI